MRKKKVIKSFVFLMFLLLSVGLFINPVNAASKEPVELLLSFPVLGGTYQDVESVQEELSKITMERINARVKILPLRIGSYMQQTNLMLSGNEQLDLMLMMGPRMLTLYQSQGHLLQLDSLLNDYGQGITDRLSEDLLQATTFGGQVYAVMPVRCFASGVGLLMRKDILDEYNISKEELQAKVDSIEYIPEKLDVFDSLFAKIEEDKPNVAPLIPTVVGRGIFVTYNDCIQLGDNFGVLMDMGKNTDVVNWYGSEKYKDILDKAREWYKAGYIMKGAATNQESAINLIKANRGFSYITTSAPGMESGESVRIGKEMVQVDLIEPYVTTNDLQLATWGIPRSSADPEKAMQLLNLMFSDPNVANILSYGVEGKHYKLNEKGRVEIIEGGGYNVASVTWFMGNQYLQYKMPADLDNLYQQMQEINQQAFTPKSLGFIFNSEPVKTEVAALTAVEEEFNVALESGIVDPDKILPQFLKRLEDAGIEKVVAEKQRQLDEWAEKNNIK